jgi:hypothetical protein
MGSQYMLNKDLQLLRTETQPPQIWRLKLQPLQERMAVYYRKKQ